MKTIRTSKPVLVEVQGCKATQANVFSGVRWVLANDRALAARSGSAKPRTVREGWAARRINPEGKAWLPVLENTRNGWPMTALYSNTARAHKRGKTATES